LYHAKINAIREKEFERRGIMEMRKFISVISITLIIAALLIAAFSCKTPAPPTDAPKPSPPAQEKPTEVKPPQDTKPQQEPIPDFPLTVVDDLGRNVTIDKLPQRIVSLAPSNTEILFALGLEDEIVGVTDYCDYPEAAKAKPRVSSFTTPNLEKLVSLDTDLILAAAIHEKTVLPALENLGLPVFVSSAESINDVLNNIALIGKINGKSIRATEIVNEMKTRIDAVRTKTDQIPQEKRPGVLVVVWHKPIWTMGAKTFVNDMILTAGGRNIFAEDFEKSRIASLEAIVGKNPEVIIVSAMATTGSIVYNSLVKEDRLKSTDAMALNHVYRISNANLIERPGPRIVDGLDELSQLFHPEIFGEFNENTGK
jgi:iron complex transport system substrate-binding protein